MGPVNAAGAFSGLPTPLGRSIDTQTLTKRQQNSRDYIQPLKERRRDTPTGLTGAQFTDNLFGLMAVH